jgi:hypothetical protein
MVFNNGLDNPPEYTSLGEIGSLYNPQGISDIFRVGDTLYAFVANIDNSTITRLYFRVVIMQHLLPRPKEIHPR